MRPSVGNFAHPRLETLAMRRAPSVGLSNPGQFGPRVGASGDSDRTALLGLDVPALDVWPTFRHLAVPIEGMLRIERPDMDPLALQRGLRTATQLVCGDDRMVMARRQATGTTCAALHVPVQVWRSRERVWKKTGPHRPPGGLRQERAAHSPRESRAVRQFFEPRNAPYP